MSNILDSFFTASATTNGITVRVAPNYLNERVKSDTGIPVTKHIQHALLIEAKKLLLYTDHSINEIGMTLGFEDTSYFIRFFRKLTKKTPGEFRRKEKP